MPTTSSCPCPSLECRTVRYEPVGAAGIRTRTDPGSQPSAADVAEVVPAARLRKRARHRQPAARARSSAAGAPHSGDSGRVAPCFPRKRGKPLSSARCGCHEQSRSVACARHAPARRPQQSCRAARRTIAFHGKAVPAIRIPGLIARVTLLGKHNLLLCNSALIRSTVVTAVRPSDSACDVAWLGPSSFQRLTWIEVERMRQG
jgi:hypothetical protein